jgi:hypothetical protein
VPAANTTDRTTVADPAWVGPALFTVLPLIGAALGWGLTLVAEWITDLSWFPFQGLFELFTDLSEALQLVVGLALGVVVGIVFAFWFAGEMLEIHVDREGIRTKRGSHDQTVPRSDVESVFVQDKLLVILGRGRRELTQVEFDLDRDALAAALRQHGYAWRPDGDPYAAELKRWVPGADGLPRGADAVLKVRATALEKSKNDDLRELRDELTALGVVVRDKDKKQYWRAADPD